MAGLAMKNGEGAGSCARMTSCFLLATCFVLALIGATGSWGSTKVQMAGLYSGTGTFTLWDISVSSSIIGIRLPEQSFKIDDSLCGGGVPLTEVQQVCDTFKVMRTFTILALISVLGASGSASAVFCLAHKRLISGSTLLAGLLAALAAAFAVIALGAAMSLPRDNEYFESTQEPGAGSICMALLVVLCVGIVSLQVLALCRARHSGDAAALAGGARAPAVKEAAASNAA